MSALYARDLVEAEVERRTGAVLPVPLIDALVAQAPNLHAAIAMGSEIVVRSRAIKSPQPRPEQVAA